MTAGPVPWTPQARRAIRRLDWICLLLVTHGSLYPWQFAWPAAGLGPAWAGLWNVTTLWSGLGDVVGNIALFVPVGVLMLLHLEDTALPPRARLPAMLLLGTLFAWLLQVVQLVVPARDPELSDVVWNALGLLAGAALARVLPRLAAATGGRVDRDRALALGLAALWLAIQWWPLTPTIDWQQVKDALKPLLRDPSWRTPSVLEAALGVLALAHLLRGLRHRAAWVAGLLALALGGKLFIAGQAISFSHALGAALGLAAALPWARMPAQRSALALVAATLCGLTADQLRPFELAEQSSSFEFIPFVALLQGSLQANTQALMAMTFWVGLVMVLGLQIGARLAGLAVALSLWLLLLEAAQTWLPGRTAEVTPALVPWLWWLLLQPLAAPAAAPLSPPPRRRRSAR